MAGEISHRARLVKDLTPVGPIEGNEGRIGQVILNLLVNAAHAIPAHSVDDHQICITLAPRAAGGVSITISDTGCGIPAEVLPRIFDPFFTTKPVGVGTGLGLYICQNIVAGMGGRIEVETEVGRGTTFRLELPVHATDRVRSAPTKAR